MQIDSLKLTNFRSWRRLKLEFDPGLTVIAGPNASGKTNIAEAVAMLATGQAFRAERDQEIIAFNTHHVSVEGVVETEGKKIDLRVTLLDRGMKRLALENIGKRLIDFAGNLQVVVFWPADLELVIDSPSLRRRFMDQALSLIDRSYRRTLLEYGKVLTARNRILDRLREGTAREGELDFWDNKLVDLGGYITHNREILFLYLNGLDKNLGPISWTYRPSIIGSEKLEKMRQRDIDAGLTLSGPQRDDFIFLWDGRDLSLFGSRGEQRIAVLALKLGELEFLADRKGERPVLILDDIFSELDDAHRQHVLGVIGLQQTILTTTDIGSIPAEALKKVKIIRADRL